MDNMIKQHGDKPTCFQDHEYFLGIYDIPREVNPVSNKKLKLTFKNMDFDNIAIVFLMPLLFPLLLFILFITLVLEQRNEFKVIFGGLWKIYSKKLEEIKILKEGIFLMEEKLKERKNIKEMIYGEIHEDFIKEVV
jgi:phosphoenolpyruvate synthase/pyruvate phosphate dikinase